MQFSMSALSGEQIRAARALARIDQSELAGRCGLSLETIKRLERIRGPVGATSRTLGALFKVFSDMGVVFESGEGGGVGVRLAPRGPSGLEVRPGPAFSASQDTARRVHDAECHRLIYYSSTNPGNASPLHELLDQIQASGSQRKAAMDVTGNLFAYDGRFLSVLEGPKDSVRQVYGAISCDRRHSALSIISDQKAPARHFTDWTVCCGRFLSDAELFGDEPALREGFHPEGLSPAAALGLLSLMRDLREALPRRNLHSRSPCPLADACLDRACARGAAGPDPVRSADSGVGQSVTTRP
ncbi:MAG: BLUF domain-containing protein [Allosphingosinicella sp.]